VGQSDEFDTKGVMGVLGRIRALRLMIVVRIVILLVFLGGVLLGVGWLTDGYLSDLLLNIGTALLLFAPLLLLQRRMEQELLQLRDETRSSVEGLSSDVADIRRQAHETAARLDQLGEATRSRIREQQDIDTKAFHDFDIGPSRTILLQILFRALQLRAISWRGIRVQVPGTWERLRFATGETYAMDGSPATIPEEEYHPDADAGPILWAAVESLYGEVHDIVEWLPGQPAEEFMAEVAGRLQSIGRYRDDTFDAASILRDLKAALRIAIEGRTGVGQFGELAPIIEIPNDQWIIQTTGLSSPRYGYFIPADRVVNAGSEREGPSLDEHMKEKRWVDSDKFEMACDIARGLYMTEKKNEMPF
jgi:hypothetical protein